MDFNKMPDEILEEVFKNLPATDLKNFSCVDKRWYRVIARSRFSAKEWKLCMRNTINPRRLRKAGDKEAFVNKHYEPMINSIRKFNHIECELFSDHGDPPLQHIAQIISNNRSTLNSFEFTSLPTTQQTDKYKKLADALESCINLNKISFHLYDVINFQHFYVVIGAILTHSNIKYLSFNSVRPPANMTWPFPINTSIETINTQTAGHDHNSWLPIVSLCTNLKELKILPHGIISSVNWNSIMLQLAVSNKRLENLSMAGMISGSFPALIFPCLKEISLTAFPHNEHFINFLKKNPTIKTINLTLRTYSRYMPRLFEIIENPNIKKLKITMNESMAASIVRRISLNEERKIQELIIKTYSGRCETYTEEKLNIIKNSLKILHQIDDMQRVEDTEEDF